MTLRSRSWVIDFNRYSGKAQVRRATLSCDSSYCSLKLNVLNYCFVNQRIKPFGHLCVLIFHYRSEPFDHLTAVSGADSNPTRAHVRHVLLVGVPGGFSQDSPIFAPPTDWPVLMS